MFELSIAYKYLMPRWRQLSVSIISLISILVISLVVWLILVFFSVTDGLEKIWVEKLIALSAPVRVTPTEAYYKSYYYLVDGISAQSGYTYKSLTDKRKTLAADPYDPEFDEEIPPFWATPDREADGSLKDIVKKTFQAISETKGLPPISAQEFEITFTNLHLKLNRVSQPQAGSNQSVLSHTAYLGSFDPNNHMLKKALMPLEPSDIANLIENLAFIPENNQDLSTNTKKLVSPQEFRKRMQQLFSHVVITALKTAEEGWIIPTAFLPEDLVTQEPVRIKGAHLLPAKLIEETLLTAKRPRDLKLAVEVPFKGKTIEVKIPYGLLPIGSIQLANTVADAADEKPLWIHSEGVKRSPLVLPNETVLGDGVLLPKSFRDAGILIGDQGFLSYYAATNSAMQEQRLPIYVAGFFDPGIMPLGGKFILAGQSAVSNIRSSQEQQDQTLSTGINVRFDDLQKADNVKIALQEAFKQAGVHNYWKVDTYREFEFTKDLLQQLHSEKNLFSLISIVIIIVACSNIISMLIILVNDKKVEIGILMAMGATSKSIALIFGFCGVIMGALGGLIGVGLALLTLRNLQGLMDFLGKLQGHEMFNAIYYGNTLPNELSYGALLFVMVTTVVISLLAGIVPAIKASLLRPSAILRSE